MNRLHRWLRPAVEPSPIVPARVVAGLVRDALATDGEVAWRARGTSMRGAIADGSIVRLVPAHEQELVVGDVVLALLPTEQLVVHRIAHIDEDRLVLRGDALRSSDPVISFADVVGRAAPTPSLNRMTRAHRLIS